MMVVVMMTGDYSRGGDGGGDEGAGSDGGGGGIVGGSDGDGGCSSGNETSRGVSLPFLRLRGMKRPSGMCVPEDCQNSGETTSSHRRIPEQRSDDPLPS